MVSLRVYMSTGTGHSKLFFESDFKTDLERRFVIKLQRLHFFKHFSLSALTVGTREFSDIFFRILD